MTPQTNVATALTQMAHAQQQRKAAQQTRPMVPPNNVSIHLQIPITSPNPPYKN